MRLRLALYRLSAAALAVVAALSPALAPISQAASRIKDIADFEGVRDNMLVGYGLVVGLKGTGDTLNRSIFTRESLIGMLERLGVNARDNSLKTDNVAAVMVTATLPPFARQGLRIDVTVSALGDAKSLLGGTLLVTPMLGADGEIYAVAQGSIATGGFTARGQAASVTKGVPTAGRISNGAIVEREVGFEFDKMSNVKLMLRNPDLTTARRIGQVIDAHLGLAAARAMDPSTVEVQVPPRYRGDVVALLTDIEQLRVEPDQPARVVIDEQNGVIVMGENVRISTIAIAQGSLTVRITETPQVSQPAPFAPGPAPAARGGGTGGGNGAQVPPGGGGAQTVVVPRTNIQVDEGTQKRMAYVPSSVSLRQLVDSLNALGVGPRDLISILQAIKVAGAMQADIEVM
ncbi:MAG TPA: flagellar basal body P-ring protein FlgI [Stellaceae bacterium]|nr:flagellar basal body P-ring protein FlgI [Stellaceae bacterium]